MTRIHMSDLRPGPGLALAAAVHAVILLPVMAFTKLGREMLGDVRNLISRRVKEAG